MKNFTMPQNITSKVSGIYSHNFKLMISQSVQFEDGLLVSLSDFSHKRATVNSSKATAYLHVLKNGQGSEIALSVIQSPEKPFVFEALTWQEYAFELKEMDYNESIVILISKK